MKCAYAHSQCKTNKLKSYYPRGIKNGLYFRSERKPNLKEKNGRSFNKCSKFNMWWPVAKTYYDFSNCLLNNKHVKAKKRKEISSNGNGISNNNFGKHTHSAQISLLIVLRPRLWQRLTILYLSLLFFPPSNEIRNGY